MICGIDVDALLGGLQDKLNEAKDAALGMVNQLAADAKAEADKLKESMEEQIRGWMAELPELPELPKIPMSVELMALASKLAGYASDLANDQLPQDAKDAIAQEMAKAKKAFKDSWGPGLEKQGIDLDKLLDALNGKGDLDPCALIPNLQKGVDGLITMAPNMPTFPIEGALKEIKSEISAAATEAKGAIDAVGEVVSANVDVVAKQMQKVQDSTSAKTADDMKKARSKKSPSNSKTSTIKEKIVDVKEHKQFIGMNTRIIIVEDFEPDKWFSHGYFKLLIGYKSKATGDYKGRIMSGQFFFDNKNEIYAKHSVIDFGYTINAGNKADTLEVTAANNVKLKEIRAAQVKQTNEFLTKAVNEIEATGEYTFVSGGYKSVIQISEKNPNGSHDSYSVTYNHKVYTKKGFWD
jgi:hypothetical protein